MKILTLFCALWVVVQCSEHVDKRDVSELLRTKENLFAKPLFYEHPGYDYPRPGFPNSQGPNFPNSQGPSFPNSQGPNFPNSQGPNFPNSQGPIFRDPEPTYIETNPVYPNQQPNWIQPRPTEPTWVQNRPVEPTWVQNRPVEPSYIVRPNYRPADPLTEISQKLFWPLFNKPWLNGGGYYPGGSNTVGFPGNNNGNNYYPSYPGIPPNKFAFLGNLFPGLGSYPMNQPNYQRIAYPAPRPLITTTSDTGIVHKPTIYPVYPEQGVNSIGDSVVVDAVDASQGYNYPRPSVQLPPLNLPNSVQFRAEPKTDDEASDSQ